MFQELTRMYISMCVYGKKEINRQKFDQELHISTHVYFMILTRVVRDSLKNSFTPSLPLSPTRHTSIQQARFLSSLITSHLGH